MKLSDFDYHISKEQIALYPLPERDSSKLFVVHRDSSRFEHRTFRDIVSYFSSGDVLVLNNTKVLPARLFGVKPSGGRVEIMLLREQSKNIWESLVKGLRKGKVMLDGDIIANVSRSNGANAVVMFEFGKTNRFCNKTSYRAKKISDRYALDSGNPESKGNGCSEQSSPDIKTILHKIGAMPLPPYIKRPADSSDTEQYQTVYANREGAIAAPTAGLHFTEELLTVIKSKGVSIEKITLHVGYGTFKPVTVHDINEHNMDEESYEIPVSAADAINHARSEGRRVIAVGTTVTRALESAVSVGKGLYSCPVEGQPHRGSHAKKKGSGRVEPGTGKTSIFIYPGFQFKVIDALITNFHLPKSTPMMLASAFTGLSILKKSYSEAQKDGYRFFSYGDAMLIL